MKTWNASQVALTTPTNFPIGTKVRSFDFPGRRDCYIEGTVVSVDAEIYGIEVTARVLEGKPGRAAVGSIVYPPINGLPTWTGGVTAGVEAV